MAATHSIGETGAILGHLSSIWAGLVDEGQCGLVSVILLGWGQVRTMDMEKKCSVYLEEQKKSLETRKDWAGQVHLLVSYVRDPWLQ